MAQPWMFMMMMMMMIAKNVLVFFRTKVYSFRTKQSMNSSSAGIYGYITQVWMIWVANGKCGW
jgi:hypothetical protein